MLGGRVPVNCGGTGARDVATAQSNLQVYSKTYINTELNKKFDKTKISQGIGPSTEHVMSQKASVDAFQPKGNYLDKSSSLAQEINANFLAKRWIIAKSSNDSEAILYAASSNNVGISARRNGEWMGDIKHPMDGKSGTLARIEDIEALSTFPIGSPIPWPQSTAPSGYLICNGQTFNKSTYPKLAIAYPSGKLPDLRGEFIRGLDSGRGIDAGRSVLSAQKGNSLLSSNIFGGLSSSESNKWHKAINYIGITGTDNDGGYGVHQQIEGANGNETRPRNIAFLYIVRAA
ncbi:TPA: tail fiber protein [Proteus mirabilis]|nr:tail fiber protein [Proteus mirabilis]